MSQPPPPPPPAYGPPGQPYGQQPYGAPVPPPGGRTRLRGRVPLILSLVLGVLGIVAISVGAVVLANGSFNKIDDFTRADLGSQVQTVRFDRSGKFIGYLETPSDGSHRADVRLALATPGDEEIPVRLYRNTLTYDFNGRYGEALFTFTVPKAGEYQVLARSDNAPRGARMAFGESVAGGIVAGVLLIVPGILLVVAAIILLIVGLVRRGRHKRELRTYWQHNPGV